MSEDKTPIVIYSTFGDLGEARQVGRLIVEVGLGACVNLLPAMVSIYKWEGQIEESEEVVMIVKGVKMREEALISFIRSHHSYDEPAIVVIPITGGAASYLDWIGANVR